LYITTKIYDVDVGPSNSRLPVKDVLKKQLKDLQVDYVDLYLIHSPVFYIGRDGGLAELWKEVEEVKREGLAKDIGISNFRVDDLNELLPTITTRSDGILPAVNQVR
jgi:diketogulonate reductase-like aldo/keto reductase